MGSVKHICHVTTVHARYDTRVFVKQCASLAKAGFKVTLVVADGKGDEVCQGVEIRDIGKPTGRFARITKMAVLAKNTALSLKADIYQLHDPELTPYFFIPALRGRKVVFDIHEDLQGQIFRKYWLPKWAAYLLLPFVKVWEWLCARLFEALISVTPKLVNRYLTYTENVTEVRNYPLASEFSSADLSDYCQRPKSIFYVGGITLDRGIKTMLDALQRLPDVRLNLAGRFSNGELEGFCQSHPSWAQVDYHGWCSRDDVAALAQKSRIGIVVLSATGDYEDALPVKMFEYMASGLPVICSDFPLWKSIVDEAQCGFYIAPENAKALADKIQTLMSEEDTAKSMGDNGRRAVSEKFEWHVEFNELKALYERLLN
ncbi:glycosyltransferase family 4 protein [Alteromonas sp. a30]|uniref:glycosyltransferase family 4 protein n=1 Tax=Alteromonas sp. a30 TaxID=2730917 RepID=UPI0022804C35|nr:glycosyltransferase family 4 protein [Alteromonas sp. a30]MCY7294390.1 glycosyltransferase family 4 protein [Alteromonas sp. a30]